MRVGSQEYRQPLQRAGIVAGGKTRFRAKQTHGIRVVDVQPVHDDCLRWVATIPVGLAPECREQHDNGKEAADDAVEARGGLRHLRGCRLGWQRTQTRLLASRLGWRRSEVLGWRGGTCQTAATVETGRGSRHTPRPRGHGVLCLYVPVRRSARDRAACRSSA